MRFVHHKVYYLFVIVSLLLIVTSCSITRHVPEGKYLLDDVKIEIDSCENLQSSEFINYLRQVPNHRVLGKLRLQLMFYNISGKDSTSKFNRWIRKIGAAPVIYDEELTEASTVQLQKALQNRGYIHASVKVDTFPRPEKKKMKVVYTLSPGNPYVISSMNYEIPNDTLKNLILGDSALFSVKQGDRFDLNNLELERQQITLRLRNKGYYAFNKEYITYVADTAENSFDVNVTMKLMPPYKNERMAFYTNHRPFYVRNVVFVTNYDPMIGISPTNTYFAEDTVLYKGLTILYGKDKYLRPGVIEESCFINAGQPYNALSTSKTYEAFGRLGILKFININYQPVGEIDGKVWLDAYVLLTKGKSQSVSLALEGTNSEGDLGFGVGVSYQHRNIGHGAEILNAKFKTSYESLSGNLKGLINDNYNEYSADVGIVFPKFKAPFLSKDFKQKILATTELATTFTYQERPEFTRVIAGAGWKYHWTQHNNTKRQTFDLLDINYVYLPKSKLNFLDSIANPLLRYSYENHFIVKMGYVFYYTNKKSPNSIFKKRFQRNIYTFRAAVETAGNFLYAFSNIFHQKKEDDSYKIFGINYSQYLKLEADYTFTHKFTPRQMIALHVGGGVGIPYGNSTILPFEKRFYAGGANGVRGWAVRTLGPGCFAGDNSVDNFINQCGDIRLNLSFEYRTKLFWVFELGAFVDAGNIWTIREYENQPGGLFKFDSFWKEIAMSYGLGLRLDFTYFLLRFDLGMKAYNPAEGACRWPIFHPDWKRDHAFHFSVGYPF